MVFHRSTKHGKADSDRLFHGNARYSKSLALLQINLTKLNRSKGNEFGTGCWKDQICAKGKRVAYDYKHEKRYQTCKFEFDNDMRFLPTLSIRYQAWLTRFIKSKK